MQDNRTGEMGKESDGRRSDRREGKGEWRREGRQGRGEKTGEQSQVTFFLCELKN